MTILIVVLVLALVVALGAFCVHFINNQRSDKVHDGIVRYLEAMHMPPSDRDPNAWLRAEYREVARKAAEQAQEPVYGFDASWIG